MAPPRWIWPRAFIEPRAPRTIAKRRQCVRSVEKPRFHRDTPCRGISWCEPIRNPFETKFSIEFSPQVHVSFYYCAVPRLFLFSFFFFFFVIGNDEGRCGIVQRRDARVHWILSSSFRSLRLIKTTFILFLIFFFLLKQLGRKYNTLHVIDRVTIFTNNCCHRFFHKIIL